MFASKTFDHVQHNELNPILAAFRRETVRCAGRHPLSECAKLALHFEEDGDFPNEPQAVKDHARKVLSRLTALQEQP